MRNGHKATSMRQKWIGLVVLLAALLVTSAEPGYAWRGGQGYRHGGQGYRHGGQGYRHGGYGYRHGGRVFIRPHVVFPIGPFFAPYWEPYGYSSIIVTPPPQVYVQPAPETPVQPPSVQPPPAQPPTQHSWYYCEDPQGYYPYVQQCPGGWRSVPATPPAP